MDAERRDAEMAKQLTEIKEQALERIRESTAAAREVATLKERCHASELERDRLRDKVQELEHDERDHRELRRMARDASTPPRRHARRRTGASSPRRGCGRSRRTSPAFGTSARRRTRGRRR